MGSYGGSWGRGLIFVFFGRLYLERNECVFFGEVIELFVFIYFGEMGINYLFRRRFLG